MTWPQFAMFLVALVVSVEVALRLRWKSIERMFERALTHGGSVDAYAQVAVATSERAEEAAALAQGAVANLKVTVDGHAEEIRKLKEHPLLRPLGGNRP